MSAVVLGVAAEALPNASAVISTCCLAASFAAASSTGSVRANAAWFARKRASSLALGEPAVPPADVGGWM